MLVTIQITSLNPRERIGFAELSANWRIGFPLLAAKSFNL
jgi:hypothetical protein